MTSSSYYKDPKTCKILITDEYDFLNKYNSNKDGSFENIDECAHEDIWRSG